MQEEERRARPVQVVEANHDEEDDDDSQDEDFTPGAKAAGDTNDASSGAESGEDADVAAEYDSGDEKTIGAATNSKKRKRNAIQNRTDLDSEGGLVKTRAQRAQETQETKAAPVAKSTATDIEAMWAMMNAPKNAATQHPESSCSTIVAATRSDVDTIEIDRTYEFAGEVHHEKKVVPKDSAEARDYLSSLPPPTDTNSGLDPAAAAATVRTHNGVPLRKVIKRKSMLETTHGKPKKINTLEKSRMEWSGFVDKEGINDHLKRGNMNGYLDKQDFLQRSGDTSYQLWKAGQAKK